MNQIPNGGLNMNLPRQTNFPPGNLQQPISGNFQGNLQPSLSLQDNLQQPGGSVSLGNLPFSKQGLQQLPPGLVINPSKSQSGPPQTNNGCQQNAPLNQQQNNVNPTSNVSPSQTQNAPYSSNSLAELAALKGHPSLLSLFASQNNIAQPQQNQQIANFNPSQNQLSDAQKQFLVRALQSQSSGQNQPTGNFAQTQYRVGGGGENWPIITIPGPPPQQAQAIVTPIASQPQYITMQAQPVTSYIPNQPPQLVEEPSILNLILSELQATDPQYSTYPAYAVQKRESKSSLKTLIPLIINLLKEKNNCGCQNNGCPNNGCVTNNAPEPTIFGGYSSLMNYGQGTVETTTKEIEVEDKKSKSNKKEKKNVKKNVVKVDSEELSEEIDSEEVDYSEEE